MNLFVSAPPTSLTIAAQDYPINSDFRTWAQYEQALIDKNLSKHEKAEKLLQLVFPKPQELPLECAQEIVEKTVWFYGGGDKTKNQHQLREEARRKREGGGPRYYDFFYDADYIESAFLQQYGINLSNIEYLHWWEFCALFIGLTDDTQFMTIMGYRAMKNMKGMTDSQKKFYKKMKQVYALPTSQKEQDENAAIAEALKNGDTKALMKLLRESQKE